MINLIFITRMRLSVWLWNQKEKKRFFFSIIGRTLWLLNLQNLLIFDQLVLIKYTVKTEPLNSILN